MVILVSTSLKVWGFACTHLGLDSVYLNPSVRFFDLKVADCNRHGADAIFYCFWMRMGWLGSFSAITFFYPPQSCVLFIKIRLIHQFRIHFIGPR